MLFQRFTPQVVRRFVQFVIIGLSCVVVDLIVLNLLVKGFWIDGYGVNVYVATTISFLCGATNGYYWNRKWTFRDAPRKYIPRQYSQFVIVGVSGFVLSLLLMALFIEGLGLHYNVARLGSIAIVAVWDFALQSVWTFGHSSKDGPPRLMRDMPDPAVGVQFSDASPGIET
jgi:putative flippase GtrA